MAEQAAKEPTMEEILSSIRRIISEGGDPETEAGSAETSALEVEMDSDSDEAFDVSSLLGDDTSAEAEGEHLLSVDELLSPDDLDFGDIDDLDPIEVADIDVPPLSEDVSAEPQVELDDGFANDVSELETLMQDETAISSEPHPVRESETVAAVSEAPPVVTPAPAAAATLSASGNSALEGLVSELMKPVIKEWIDTNLPAIVERRVEAEINQIAAKVISALRDA